MKGIIKPPNAFYEPLSEENTRSRNQKKSITQKCVKQKNMSLYWGFHWGNLSLDIFSIKFTARPSNNL